MKATASVKEKYLWNTLGGLASSFMSIILLIVVNRAIGNELGGVFSFAYSHSQLMYTIAVFEVRPLQCTDIKERFKFSTYFSLRVVTCIIMLILSVAYIMINGMIGTKAWTILLLCIYKVVEAYTDLYAAYFQQMDRIDYSGKTIVLRAVASSAGFILVLVITKSLIAAVGFMIVISILTYYLYDIIIWKDMGNNRKKMDLREVKPLILEAFPLFLSTFIMMYINNAPKYAINRFCTDLVQNKYNIIFMPAFVINMFSVFVFRPMLTSMTERWNENRIYDFVKDILKVFAVIFSLTVLCIGGSAVLGIPVLSVVYNTNLSGSLGVLLLVMVYGGLNALVVFLYYVITVTRKQRYLIIGYLSGFLISLIFAPLLVKKYEMMGAIFSAIISMSVLDAILIVILILIIKRRKLNAKANS